MNRPPGPDPGRDPWYQRRPTSDDHTAAARPRPHQPRPAPPGRYPPPTPWYLQRPDRPLPPMPAVERQSPTAKRQAAEVAARQRPSRPLLIGVGIVAVLIAAAVLPISVSKVGATGGKVLDVAKVQAGVLQTLSDPAGGYGANAVTDVSCNNGHNPSADKGTTFTCEATVNGAQRHVAVVVSDDNGTYEIDSPR